MYFTLIRMSYTTILMRNFTVKGQQKFHIWNSLFDSINLFLASLHEKSLCISQKPNKTSWKLNKFKLSRSKGALDKRYKKLWNIYILITFFKNQEFMEREISCDCNDLEQKVALSGKFTGQQETSQRICMKSWCHLK